MCSFVRIRLYYVQRANEVWTHLLYDCSYSPRSKIRGQGLDLFFGTAFGAGAKKLDLARVLPN